MGIQGTRDKFSLTPSDIYKFVVLGGIPYTVYTMPRTTVYIRNDDLEKWKLIENKAELISQAINRSIIQPVIKKSGEIKTRQTIVPSSVIPLLEKVTGSDWKPCKHGADPKFCKFAKPGKPCK